EPATARAQLATETVGEPSPPKKSTLLGMLRSSPFRKSKPEPEPPPPPAVAPTPPETGAPLTDVFAELIQAARAVAPTAPPATAEKTPPPAKVAPPSKIAPAPTIAPPPAPVVTPIESPWAAAEATEAASVAELPAPDTSAWPTWNVEEFRQTQ